MKKQDGGPAFPEPGRAQSAKQRQVLTNVGMSLRDFFAAKALASLICEPSWGGSNSLTWTLGPKTTDVALNYAKVAYQFADAMLEARK